MQALVSILLPFRNTDAFLGECLQSVKEQDYPLWELIAVDDHSEDGSWQLLERFAVGDARIRLVKNEGRGVIRALQTAYAYCRGEFVTRMDSDDIMPSNKLSNMITSLKAHGPGHLAVGKVRYFSIRGISDGYQRYENWLNQLTHTGTNFREIYKECPIPSPAWMAFKADLHACGAFEGDRYPEDYDLSFRFYRHGLKVIPCQAVLHYWRDYDTRTSRTSVHYAQNYFLDIKMHYFLKLDYDTGRPLVLWGAGNKGKTLARILLKEGIPFSWVCDNPRKIGKNIYGKTMGHYHQIDHLSKAQSIITVANEASQGSIREYMACRGLRPMEDYYFFC